MITKELTQGNTEEYLRVEECSHRANYSGGVMQYATAYCGQIFKSFMVSPGSVLELGPAEGVMTDLLYPAFPDDYTIVDGTESFVASIQERYPDIKCYRSLFEDFYPERSYDNIILGHVLEHVEDPERILQLCTEWVRKPGRIMAAVPNSESIHRQAAVHMGLLNSTKQLNKTDLKNGHRRVYDKTTLEYVFHKAGLKIVKSGGYWLKPLSNSQIDENWSKEMINSFMLLGEMYPEIAAEIYIVADFR